jgi:hypothetical protein
MSAKGVPLVETSRSKDEYLRDPVNRACRRRHDTPPSNIKKEQVYNHPEWNFWEINRCKNGCGYSMIKPGYRAPDGQVTWYRPRRHYENKEYLRTGEERIYPRDAAEYDVNEWWLAQEQAAERAKTRRTRAAAKKAEAGAARPRRSKAK